MKKNESKSVTKNHKSAIIYCRAADMEAAKRQQEKAEAKAKNLNAIVQAVFIDINPMQPRWKQILWRLLFRFFRKSRPRKASKQAEWRKAMIYLKEQKTNYIITASPDRISRKYTEYRDIMDKINHLGTRITFSVPLDKKMLKGNEELYVAMLGQKV